MAKNLVNLNINGTIYDQRPYTICETSYDDITKQVTISDFTLVDGATIIVKFVNGFNGRGSALQLNGITKSIYNNSTDSFTLSTGEVIMELKYDSLLDNGNGGWIVINTNILTRVDWANDDSRSPQFIRNKPELSTVAISGSYNDLSDKPTITQGTVTSITPGTGLTGTSNDEAITESGTLNLKSATTDEIGGIKVANANAGTVTTSTGTIPYGLEIDANGKGYIKIPQIPTYNAATEDALGLVKVGTGLNITEDGTLSATATTYNNATNEVAGVIKVGSVNTSSITASEEGSNYYPVNIDSSGLGYVALPSFSNATNASNIYINTSTGSSYYPMTFVTSTSAGNKKLYIDSSTTATSSSGTGIRYNPSAKTCYCSGGFYEASDERLKNFGDDIEVDLDKLSRLSKKYFTWKDDKSNTQHIGISAQEVQDIYPELVNVIDEEGHLSVSYDKLSVVALKGIDILNDKIKSLEERFERLEKLIEG